MDAKVSSIARRVVEVSSEVRLDKPKLSRWNLWRRRNDWAYDHEATSNRRELVVRRVRNPTATRGLHVLQSHGVGTMVFSRGFDRDSWMVIGNVAGHPVGLAYGYRLAAKDEAQIDDVVVDVSCRQQGLGKMVVADLMDWLVDEGLQQVNLCPAETWQQNLCQSLGFTAQGRGRSMSASLR